MTGRSGRGTKKYILSFLFFISWYTGISQAVLKGIIISDETKQPLPSASVYLNNTSLGTMTDEKGAFVISKIPAGKFNLIVSCVGYETIDTLVNPHALSKQLGIALKTKARELESFSVLPPEPDGWKIYGKLFTEVFIGDVPTRSNNCKLLNPEVIRFRLNKNNILTAYANEPLRIENYALGYSIRYSLEEFEYDYNTKLVSYSGYELFTDMAVAHSDRAKRYAEARLETYRGSMLHFMRSFYLNDLDVQGFELRSLGYISNPEKDRAKRMFSLHKDSVILDTVAADVYIDKNEIGNSAPRHIEANTVMTVDSTDYFKKMLLQPDSVISHQLITADSIGFAADSSIAGLFFSDSLEVSFRLKEIPARYRALSKEHKKETYPISQFVFVYKRPVYVLNNGYYYKPYDLKITGYWAWSENMSTRLPYDYIPVRK